MSGPIDSGSSQSVSGTGYTQGTGQDVAVQGSQVINGQSQDSVSSGSGSSKTTGSTDQVRAGVVTLVPVNEKLIENGSKGTVAVATSATQDGETPPTKEETINKAYDAAFDKLVEGKPDEKALRFAHYNSTPGTPMTALEKQAFEQIAAQFGVTSQEFTPAPQKKDFMEEVAFANDDEFTSLLQNQKPPLSKEEIAKLKYLHNNPGSSFPGSDNPELQAKLKSLEGEAKAITVAKFGIPLNSDGTPAMPINPNTKAYNATLNGIYQNNIDVNTTNFLRTGVGVEMSVADQQSLKNYLKDPTIAVSESVKAAANQIISQSKAQLIKSQNLEGIGFVPAPYGTFPPVPPAINMFMNMVGFVMGNLEEVVNALPSTGPNANLKVEYQNILAKISEALQRFQESVYASQTTTSSRAQEASNSKLELALEQIKKNGVAAADAKKQAQKMESMAKFGALIMAIVTVVMVLIAAIAIIVSLGSATGPMVALTAGVLGAVSGAVAGGMAVAATQGVMQGVITAVKMILKAIVNAIVNAVIELVASISKAIVNAAMKYLIKNTIRVAIEKAFDSLVNASLKTIGEAIGKAVMEALRNLARSAKDFYALIKDISWEAIEKAVTKAVNGALKGIGQAVDDPALAMEKVANQLLKTLKEFIANPDSVLKAGEIVAATGEIAQGALSIEQNMMTARLAIMRANADSEQTLTDAEIKNLSKLIQQLLALLAGQSDLIEYIGTTQTGMAKKASQTITAISAA